MVRDPSARPGRPHSVDLGLVRPIGRGLLIERLPAGFAIFGAAGDRIDRLVGREYRFNPAASSSRARTDTMVPPRRTDSE